MSISYVFTERNSIRIECGDEWIEVSLPHDASAAKRSRPPKSAGGLKPPVTPKQPGRLKPPTYPGAMLVIASGKTPEDDEDYLGAGIDPGAMIDLSHLDMTHIGEAMKKARKIGHARTLDVNIDTGSLSNASTLADLNRLIKDPKIDLDALRLWKK